MKPPIKKIWSYQAKHKCSLNVQSVTGHTDGQTHRRTDRKVKIEGPKISAIIILWSLVVQHCIKHSFNFFSNIKEQILPFVFTHYHILGRLCSVKEHNIVSKLKA